VVAVVEGTPPDTAVAVGDQGATAMVVVIVGGPRTRGRAMPAMLDVAAVAIAAVCRINTAAARVEALSTSVTAAMATATAYRSNTAATARACRLNTRIIPPIAAMVARAGDRTLSVTITVAAVKAVPGNLRADSLPVAVVAGRDTAQAADARPDDAKRSGGRSGRHHDDSDSDGLWVRGADCAVSPFGVFGVSCLA
jgi:hypothetical protein